jgi:MSHA biogenesis protein MshQ
VRINPPAAPLPDNALTNVGNGVTRFELLFDAIAFQRDSPTVPFDAAIAVEIPAGALDEEDGVDFSPAPGRYQNPGGGTDLPFIGAGGNPDEIRYGRLVIDNAHGSERLPLDVPLRAEYWASVAGTTGFVQNLQDNCTPLNAANFALGGPMGGPPDPPVGPADTSIQSLLVDGNGRWRLRLTAPNDTGQATVTGLMNANFPWLRLDDADVDTAHDDDPSALAAFGVFRNDERRIYQREVVGN